MRWIIPLVVFGLLLDGCFWRRSYRTSLPSSLEDGATGMPSDKIDDVWLAKSDGSKPSQLAGFWTDGSASARATDYTFTEPSEEDADRESRKALFAYVDLCQDVLGGSIIVARRNGPRFMQRPFSAFIRDYPMRTPKPWNLWCGGRDGAPVSAVAIQLQGTRVTVTYASEREIDDGRQEALQAQEIASEEAAEERRRRDGAKAEQLRKFREQLEPGTRAKVHNRKVEYDKMYEDALVIDVKPPIVHVQLSDGSKWMEIKQLFPPDY